MDSKSKINQIVKTILEKRPKLVELATEESVLEYYRPALEWKQNEEVFPNTSKLSEVITADIKRLYGPELADQASEHLKESWVIETGAHLNIPRRFDKPSVEQKSRINSVLVQGQVLWAASGKALGRNMSISLNSGRVPADNTNSGAYLDLPALKAPITLVSRKKHPDSPQSLISARTVEDIEEKIRLLEMYRIQKLLPEDQYLMGMEVLQNFLKVRSSFADQVATTHAMLLNKVLPLNQITLDSEPIARDYFIKLLKDKSSLIYKIFSDKTLTEKFTKAFVNIRTGWVEGETPFYYVLTADEGYRLVNYRGDLDPKIIVKGLEDGTMFLKGVLKYFALMAEAGIVPVGGWTQAGYCTEIKTQAIKFLNELGYSDRAEVLEKMPTHIAAVAPCWGIHQEENGDYLLLDPITMILNPSLINLTAIPTYTGNQVLLIGAPALYEFLKDNESLTADYKDFMELLSFSLVEKSKEEKIHTQNIKKMHHNNPQIGHSH